MSGKWALGTSWSHIQHLSGTYLSRACKSQTAAHHTTLSLSPAALSQPHAPTMQPSKKERHKSSPYLAGLWLVTLSPRCAYVITNMLHTACSYALLCQHVKQLPFSSQSHSLYRVHQLQTFRCCDLSLQGHVHSQIQLTSTCANEHKGTCQTLNGMNGVNRMKTERNEWLEMGNRVGWRLGKPDWKPEPVCGILGVIRMKN